MPNPNPGWKSPAKTFGKDKYPPGYKAAAYDASPSADGAKASGGSPKPGHAKGDKKGY